MSRSCAHCANNSDLNDSILSKTRVFGMPILQNNSDRLSVIVFDLTFRTGIVNGQQELRQESVNTYLLPLPCLLRRSLPNTSVKGLSHPHVTICLVIMC